MSLPHLQAWDLSKDRRYTDARKDEQERCLSIKATPASMVLQGSSGKSFLVNAIDTPGHVNFRCVFAAYKCGMQP